MNKPLDVEAANIQADQSVVEPLYLHLAISDPEVVKAVSEYPVGPQRSEFVNVCIKIGVLSLRAARGLVDGESIRREGDHLIESLTDRFNSYRENLVDGVSGSLTHYFDPTNGLFSDRIRRLVSQDGEIASVIQDQLRQANAGLTSTFEQFVGENSAFFKVMAPDDSNALLSAMRKSMDGLLQNERTVILGQFSLDDPASALSRTLRELSKNHGDIGDALRKDMDGVVKEFSLDNKNGALSRLVDRVEDAQAKISREFSLDHEDSALSRMRLDMHSSLETISRNQMDFQKDVVQLLQKITSKKEEAAKSTLHGAVFEEAVGSKLQTWAMPAGDVLEACGNNTGQIRMSKVGDYCLTLCADSAAAGAVIVVEAKEDASYTLRTTLDEIDVARRNRSAGVGLFVHSARTAPASLDSITRHGSDIIVVWDAEDDRSDVVLRCGFLLAKALSVKAANLTKAEAASFVAMDKAIETLRKQLEGFEEIRKAAETVESSGSKIQNRVRIMNGEITKQMDIVAEHIVRLKEVMPGAESQASLV